MGDVEEREKTVGLRSNATALNSALAAIRAYCQGVRLWGVGSAGVLYLAGRRMDEELLSFAYADDWAGCFPDVKQLRRAWAIWRAWEHIVGAKLGVKGKIKTAISAVHWVDGTARTPADPQLRTADGKMVPMLAADEAYKHLGVWRSLDA